MRSVRDAHTLAKHKHKAEQLSRIHDGRKDKCVGAS